MADPGTETAAGIGGYQCGKETRVRGAPVRYSPNPPSSKIVWPVM